jgi:hypothetical protein
MKNFYVRRSTFCVLRSRYSRSPSLHASGCTPVTREYRSVDSTEYAGRTAGRGNSSVDTGFTVTPLPSSCAIAVAKSNHVHSSSSA